VFNKYFSIPLQYTTIYPIETFLQILNKNTTTEWRVFENQMLRGSIVDQKIDATIIGKNTGNFLTIGSKIQGTITQKGESTIFNCVVKFSRVYYGILILFSALPIDLIYSTQQFKYSSNPRSYNGVNDFLLFRHENDTLLPSL